MLLYVLHELTVKQTK